MCLTSVISNLVWAQSSSGSLKWASGYSVQPLIRMFISTSNQWVTIWVYTWVGAISVIITSVFLSWDVSLTSAAISAIYHVKYKDPLTWSHSFPHNWLCTFTSQKKSTLPLARQWVEFIPLSAARKIFFLTSSLHVGWQYEFAAATAAEQVSVETSTKTDNMTNYWKEIFTPAER